MNKWNCQKWNGPLILIERLWIVKSIILNIVNWMNKILYHGYKYKRGFVYVIQCIWLSMCVCVVIANMKNTFTQIKVCWRPPLFILSNTRSTHQITSHRHMTVYFRKMQIKFICKIVIIDVGKTPKLYHHNTYTKRYVRYSIHLIHSSIVLFILESL